ncbi:hypothetical protein Barb7_01329 [Bacteroidales bacterium Barb7]|nr:hypothetical protein Barb7_01329 [Bacteroidales bacterium Barb7]
MEGFQNWEFTSGEVEIPLSPIAPPRASGAMVSEGIAVLMGAKVVFSSCACTATEAERRTRAVKYNRLYRNTFIFILLVTDVMHIPNSGGRIAGYAEVTLLATRESRHRLRGGCVASYVGVTSPATWRSRHWLRGGQLTALYKPTGGAFIVRG